MPASSTYTAGHLLGGRVDYAQPRTGFRSGIEPVLLAAAVPARNGDSVVEGGSGAGAALLCLVARVPGVQGVGLERDPAMAELANRNGQANRLRQLRFVAADIASLSEPGPFDHACANPPYHQADGTPSPDASRQRAKQGPDDLLGVWAHELGRRLRARGTLTFILSVSRLADATAAFTAAGCRPTAALPLWPRSGQSAKLVVLQGVKGSRSPFRLLPGLVLHTESGAFTAGAEAVLRDGQPLVL